MSSIPQRLRGDSISLRAIYPSQKPACYFTVLIANKFTFCIGVFLVYDILRHVHIIPLVCLLKLIAGGIFLLVQKPLRSGKSITETQWLYIILLAVARIIISLLWFYGMSLCGPFRSILVFEQCDFIVVAGFAALSSGAGGPAAFRGAILFLTGLFVLLFLDHDDPHPDSTADHARSGISWMGLADHKVGVLLLVKLLLAQVGVNSLASKLGSDLGGQKRLHALTTALEGVLLIPLALFIQFRQNSQDLLHWSSLIPLVTVSLCIYIVNFYINSFCLQRLEVPRVSRVGTVAVFGLALFTAFLWQQAAEGDHSLSGGSVFACVLFILAATSLTSDYKLGAKGSFIGYSETGLPLYSFGSSALHQTSKSFILLCGSIVKQILGSPNSRKIFYFLCLNMCFTVVEFLYGVWTNSLGLISDGFHMLFDCSALIMGLVAAVMTKWKPSRTFSYGYNRVEDLSGFVNGLFLLVISIFVFTEAVSRLFDPPEINTNQLLAVSVAGLFVNLLGIFVFSRNSGDGSHGHSHGGGSHGHSHNANMEGVFLHILADTLGSVGVITSSLLIEHLGWVIADPICSILIAILIFISVLPLLKNSAKVLLLSVPPILSAELAMGLQKVLAIDGVVSVKDPHLWLHTHSQNVGTLRVQVTPNANEQKVAQQVTAIFKSFGFADFTAQIEKEEFYVHLSGLGISQQYSDCGSDLIPTQVRPEVFSVKSV